MILVERRIGLLFAFFLTLLAIAGLRSLQLGTLKGGMLTKAAASQQVQQVTVPAPRGTITDRNGVELAGSEAADDVSATPYLVKDPADAAKRLAPLLGVPEDDLLRDLSRRDTGFVYLRRKLPAAQAQRVEKLGIPGIDLTPVERRVYPRNYLASQVLGGVGWNGHGNAGIEYALDSRLRGSDGTRQIVRDGVGDDVEVHDLKPAEAGARVQLTLDANIQADVEKVLQGIGRTYTPKGATAIVTDPKTGEILALANWPQIDANRPSAAPSYAQMDRAVGYNYEPGSTFKAVTIGGALEDGKVTPDTSFNLPPEIQVADRTIHNAEDRGWATLTTSQILARSDNIGAITIGERLGKQRFDYWVRRFGFGQRTGTDLPGEEQGFALPLDKYSGSSMGNLPIGQGELVTPIQIAQFYGAIANGGVLRTPHVVRKVDGRQQPEPAGRRVMSAKTAAELRQMLKGVTAPGGTASEVTVPGYEVAGKTGTANKVDPTTGEYSESKYIASFVGFAPADDPKLLISIMVDEPHGAIYGGTVAAPAFGKIAQFALSYLKIQPN